MAEYPGAVRAAVSPNRSARQGRVQLFIVHHYAGTQDPESAWRRFNAPNDRSVSPNYQVNADGSVFEVVPPDRFRAWTTGTIDHQAVTCETQNTSGAPSWGISRESHEAIAHLIAWASRRYGFPIQRGRVADGNRVEVPGVVGHRETPAGRQTSTACPGPSMDLDWLVNRARQIAGGSPAGGSEEDDMFTDQDRARLDATYAALFGPANVSAPKMTWAKPFGEEPGGAYYGALDIIIYNQALIGKLAGQIAGVAEAISQLAGTGGGVVDMAAIEAAAEKGAKDALGDLVLVAADADADAAPNALNAATA